MYDHHQAALSDEEIAVLDFAQKVILDAHNITQEDVQALRNHGLKDQEILDVILAASARSFFALALDALGVQPDVAYLEHVKGLEDVLSVGRPFQAPEDDPSSPVEENDK